MSPDGSGMPLYTLTNTQLHQKYSQNSNRAQSDLRGAARMAFTGANPIPNQ